MEANVAAERAVLAGLFQYGNNSLVDISDILNPDIFTTDINCVLYKCLNELLKDEGLNYKPDIASVLSVASKLGLSDQIEKDKTMLRAISNFPIEKENVRKQCALIYKLNLAKKGLDRLKKAHDALNRVTGDESIQSILKIVEEPVFEFSNELRTTKTSSVPKIGDGMLDYVKYLGENKRENVGISSGFPEWDASIGGGFRKGTVTLVAARSKAGKTFFSDNVGVYVSMRLGIPVLNLDTEMSREEHMTRILANIADIDIDRIEKGVFSENPHEIKKMEDAASIIEQIPYYIESVAGKPFDEIIAIIRRWIVKEVGLDSNGHALPCLIIYDYLKLMDASALKNDVKEHQAMGFQLTELNNLMVQYQSPCLSFVQLNRDGIEKEDASSVSQSDRLVWFCSSLTILKKKSPEEMASDGIKLGNRKMVVVLARHGGGHEDGDYINLTFNGSRGRMTEIGLLSKLQNGGNNNGFSSNANTTATDDDIKF